MKDSIWQIRRFQKPDSPLFPPIRPPSEMQKNNIEWTFFKSSYSL
jgi:hypothetical protein